MLVPLSQSSVTCKAILPVNKGVSIFSEVLNIEDIYLDPPLETELIIKYNGVRNISLRETKLFTPDELLWLERYGIENVDEILSINPRDSRFDNVIRNSPFNFEERLQRIHEYEEKQIEVQSIKTENFLAMATFTMDNQLSVSILRAPLLITISGEKQNERQIIQTVLNVVTKIRPTHIFSTHNAQNHIDAMLNNSLEKFKREWMSYDILKNDFMEAGAFLPLSMTTVEDLSKNAALMLFYLLHRV